MFAPLDPGGLPHEWTDYERQQVINLQRKVQADHWERYLTQTGEIEDRKRLEHAIRKLYGENEPTIIFCPSPLVACLVATACVLLSGLDEPDSASELPRRALQAALEQAYSATNPFQNNRAVWGNTYSLLYRAMRDDAFDERKRYIPTARQLLRDAAARRYGAGKWRSAWQNMTRGTDRFLNALCIPIYNGWYPQSWQHTLTHLDHLANSTQPRAALEYLLDIARAGVWAFFVDGYAVVSELPTAVHYDNRGRLHREKEAAIAFADGWGAYAVHGQAVPSRYILHPETITLAEIEQCTDPTKRRVMVDAYGIAKYALAICNNLPTAGDSCGDLFRVAMRWDEDIVLIRVKNSTPDARGERETFWLRVPPSCHTARQGVAWSFGLPEDQYYPHFES